MSSNKISDIRKHPKFRGKRLRAVIRRERAAEAPELPRLDSLSDFALALVWIFRERPLHSTLEFLGIIFAALLLFRVLPLIAGVILDIAG